MKTCSKCKVPKDLSEFNKSSKKKDGLHNYCRLCSNLKSKQAYKSGKSKHIEQVKKNVARYVQENKNFLNELKLIGCSCCPEKEPSCLQFHHLDSTSKEANVTDLLKYSRERLIKELNKCALVCANCHCKIHAGVINVTGRLNLEVRPASKTGE